MAPQDVYQFRWAGTVSGAVNVAQLRLVIYHLNSSLVITATGIARFQEIGDIS